MDDHELLEALDMLVNPEMRIVWLVDKHLKQLADDAQHYLTVQLWSTGDDKA